MKCNFDRLKPEDRTLVLVASDEKYAEIVRSINFRRLLTGLWWPFNWLWVFIPGPGWALTIASAAARASLIAADDVKTSFEILKMCLQQKEIPYPHLDPSEAIQRFRFDHGHPHDGTAYVLDPTMSDHYLLPSVANERLAQEKVAAFHDLVTALGAKRLELYSGEIDGVEAAAHAGASIKKIAADVGINATFNERGEVQRAVYAEYGRPASPPHVPECVSRWLTSDPMMRTLASSRLTGSIEKMRVSLVVDSSLAVDMKAVLGAVKAFNLDIGGSWHKVHKSTWSFEVEFWPRT